MLLIKAIESKDSWWSGLSSKELDEIVRTKEQLFELNPPALRLADLSLPVNIILESADYPGKKIAQQIADELEIRFSPAAAAQSPSVKFVVKISAAAAPDGNGYLAEATLNRRASNQVVARASRTVKNDWDISAIANNLIAKAFRHKIDPPGAPASEAELFEGLQIGQ